MKHSANNQKLAWCRASCRVLSACASSCTGPGTSIGPRSAQACSGATASSTTPISTSACRQSSPQRNSAATAGKLSVLAKPPTSVSVVMPSR